MTARIRVGTASWTDHEPFYPPQYDKASMKAQRISFYARYFSVVEVDSTFYRLMPARNFQLWAERTPEDFVFDVKAFGELTWHHRDESGEANSCAFSSACLRLRSCSSSMTSGPSGSRRVSLSRYAEALGFSLMARARGRRTSSPPQLGQTASIARVQLGQKVHSKVQM